MNITTVILFFVYTWGLGFTVTNFIKNSENPLERNLIRIGVGLGVFIVLGVVLNFLHIVLDWKIFLLSSLIVPLYVFIKAISKKNLHVPKIKLTKNNISILFVLLIFLFSLYMYVGGAFAYPYFEDDDPWAHALGTKYVSVEKTVYASEYGFHYLDPYPPGYDLLMGVLHQTSSSLMWTLKFFNGLILALGIIFFYFFAKIFMGDRKKALFSTFILAVLPSFFTHFIWAHSLVIILFFPAMYCFEMIKKDKKWMYPGMLVVGAILLVQHSQALKLGVLMAIYLLIKSIYEKRFLKEIFFTQLGGFVISLIWWLTHTLPLLNSFSTTSIAADGGVKSVSFLSKFIGAFPPNGGTATRAYTFSDFFFVQPFGGINVQIGWGVVVSLLVLLSIFGIFLFYKKYLQKEYSWIGITFIWFIFTFLGVNSMTFNLPIGLIAFRFWFLLAIPVALLSSIGLSFLYDVGKKIGFPRIMILLIVLAGVMATSGYQKYTHNTSPNWPAGGRWTSMEELEGYIWLKELPENTRVFDLSTNGEKAVLGFDKDICAWCNDTISFRKYLPDLTVQEMHFKLRGMDYQYLVVGGMSKKYLQREFGEEFVATFFSITIQEMVNSKLFLPVHQTPGMIVLRIA